MPYAKNADLPDAVRTALPPAAQSVFRKILNAALEQYPNDERTAFQTAWAGLKKTGWSKGEDGKWHKVAEASDELLRRLEAAALVEILHEASDCPYCGKDIGKQADADHEGDRRCPHCGRQIERAAESEDDSMDEPYWLNEAARKFTAEQRKEYADKGWALPDGSFPIPDADALRRAIGSWGRAVAAGKSAQVKRLLLKRAKELKASDETLDRIKNLTEAEHEDSLDQQSENVRSAWYAAQKVQTEQPTVAAENSYVQEVYDDHCIVRQGEDFFSVPYTEQDGEIVFDAGAAKKVERQWVVAEADGSTWLARPLAEAEGKDPDGSRWEVVIIKAGTSKNRRRYPEKVLKEAAPLFEGTRVLARSDDEHIEGRGKSVRNIVGWLSEVAYRSKAIRGVLNVLESEEGLRRALLDAWKRGKRDLVGLSIVAEGKGKAVIEGGQRLIDVEAIKKVSSVDLVFDPAAGGGLVKLVAALGEKEEEAMPPLEELTIEELETARPDLVEQLRKGGAATTSEGGGDPEGEPKPGEETPPAGGEPTPAPTGEPGQPTPVAVAAAEAEGDEDADLIPTQLGRFVIREALEDTTLPEVSRKRIAKQFAGKAFHEAELGSAIKDELEMWKDLEKANLVKSRGDRKDVEVGMTEATRAKAALDGFFSGADVEVDGEKVPRYRSFRQAYEDLTGDHAVSGRLPRTPVGRLGISEANGGRVDISRLVWDPEDEQFTEAIQSTTFAEILGDSVTRQMLREYTETDLRIWEPVTDVVPVRDFRTQRRMRFGGYGNLPAVAQNAAYGALTSPADEEATYAATKRGGTETITIEAIANDDVSALRRIPQRLARAAAQTLHEFVLDMMATNAAIYDVVALAAAGHNNLGTTAMSAASLKAAYARMRKQTDMSSAKRLNLIGKLLWIPIDLEDVAFEITQAERKPGTADNDANFVRKIALDYVVVPYWTDTNNWWLTASKDQTPLIEVGFYGPEDPELFAQDMPNVGEMFTNDRIVYKIRHIYSGAVMDFRGFDGSIVA